MNLGFKPRFVPRVRNGDKTHTIRGGKRWRVGMRGDLWENMRRPKDSATPQTLIFRAPIVKVEDIQFQIKRPFRKDCWSLVIEGQVLSLDEAEAFAQRDGFADMIDMIRFWLAEHGKRGAVNFDGQVVHWDYERRRMEK